MFETDSSGRAVCQTCGDDGEVEWGPGDPIPCPNCYGEGKYVPPPPVEEGDVLELDGEEWEVTYVGRWYPNGDLHIKVKGTVTRTLHNEATVPRGVEDREEIARKVRKGTPVEQEDP